jgi:hypothetical protein
MNRRASFNALATQITNLSNEQQLALVDNPGALAELAVAFVQKAIENTFVVHIDDKDVSEPLRAMIAKWRRFASELGYNGPVAWRVREGYTFKEHAAKNPHVYDKYGYLQTWEFEDRATPNAIVFWVPRLVPGSTNKNADEQREVLTAIQMRLELPEHHLSGFGDVSLVAALILAHFKRTGERTPLKLDYVRTDTRIDADILLALGYFDEGGLYCDYWWGSNRDGHIGVFALGVGLGL